MEIVDKVRGPGENASDPESSDFFEVAEVGAEEDDGDEAAAVAASLAATLNCGSCRPPSSTFCSC